MNSVIPIKHEENEEELYQSTPSIVYRYHATAIHQQVSDLRIAFDPSLHHFINLGFSSPKLNHTAIQ